MREREEILKEIAPLHSDRYTIEPTKFGERIMIELLLDIRELLQNPPNHLNG